MSEDISMIRIGDHRVGIVGLQEVSQENRLKSHLVGCRDPLSSFSETNMKN